MSRVMPGTIRRVLIQMIIVAFIPLMIIQGIIYINWYQARYREAEETNADMARAAARAFEAFVRDVQRVEASLGFAMVDLKPQTSEQANTLLRRATEEYMSVRSFHLADPQGRMVASSVPTDKEMWFNDRPYFQEIVNGKDRTVSDLLTGRVSGQPTVIIARAVRDESRRLQGVMIASVDPRRLGEKIFVQWRKASGGIYLFDRSGALVLQTRDAAWPGEQDQALRAVLGGAGEAAGVRHDGAGETYRVAYAGVEDCGWVAGADVPLSRLRRPLLRSLMVSLGLTVLVAAAAMALAWMFSHWVTAGLENLGEHARRLGAGQLTERVPESGFRELAFLAARFNEMADRLQAQTRDMSRALGHLEEANARMEREIEYRRRAQEDLQIRGAQLTAANRELEAFSYSVSHDLRTPLRGIDGFCQALMEDYGERLDAQARHYLDRIRRGTQQMGLIMDDLIRLSRLTRAPMKYEAVDLSALARESVVQLRASEPAREVDVVIAPELRDRGDRTLLRAALDNLLSNAWKFTRPVARPRIEFGAMQTEKGRAYFVRDNGVGFDMKYYDKLFGAFQRLHPVDDFPGTGIGLATVQRVVSRHGGRIWAEGQVNGGATFFFTL